MNQLNSISSLLICAANSFESHNSQIGTDASKALMAASTMPVVKPPHTVVQCKALPTTYTQHDSPLNKQIELLENLLHWNDTGATTKGAEVQQHLAFTELLGPTGMTINNNCRVGLLLQTEQAEYPNHKHAAEELYLVVSGTALWSRSNLTPETRLPGEFIHHSSWEPHAMYTTNEPMLTIWCWTGNIDFAAYEMI